MTKSGSSTGFDGLDHRDQRLAGTGQFVNTQFSLEPPDQGLCVGNGYVLEAVNTAFEVFGSDGTSLTAPEAFNQFYGLAPEINRSTGVRGDFTSDPKCEFDSATGRWFMTMLQADAPGTLPSCGSAFGLPPCSRAHILIAVSQTGDPRGAWNTFSIDATDDGLNGTPNNSSATIVCPCFGDQPLLGMNADAVFISTNEYGTPTAANTNPSNPENGAQIYSVSKSQLEGAASGSPPTVVHLNVGAMPMPSGDCCAPWDSVQPASSPAGAQPTVGYEYFLSSFTNNTGSSQAINAWVVTGTGSLQTANPNLSIQRTQVSSEAYVDDLPVSSPGTGGITDTQRGTTDTSLWPLGTALGDSLGQINANDVRMNQVVYANGKLWSGVNTALSSAGAVTRSGIAYFVVLPTLAHGRLHAVMLHQGYVAVNGDSALFPSVGVNADGHGAIGFSVVGPDYYPSAAYIRIDNGGNLVGNIVISGAGTAPDDGFTQYPQETGGLPPVGRWGDYSAAVADADGSIWMAAEYINVSPTRPRTLLANWGTFITHIGP